MKQNQNETWLYVNDPNESKCWELSYYESGKLVKKQFSIVDINKSGTTRSISENDNINEPRCVIVFFYAKIAISKDGLTAHID